MKNRKIILSLLLVFEFSDDNNTENPFFYSLEWLESIRRMNDQQFYEAFRLFKNCFSSLINKLQRDQECPVNVENKIFIFLLFISHRNTYRKLHEVFDCLNQRFL